MSLSEKIKNQIKDYINREKVALFMKGTQSNPKCSFSANIVQILNNFITEYLSIDVLENNKIRQGIKIYSNWPTIPQLYIDQKFIGGNDIVSQMYKNGELSKYFDLKINNNLIPKIQISNLAQQALKEASATYDNPKYLRLRINAKFEHSLSFQNKNEEDIIIKSNNINLIIDPISKSRSNGIKIDYKKLKSTEGFKIENPNSPPEIKKINVFELKKKFDNNESIIVFDVRTKEEWDITHLNNTLFFNDYPKNKLKQIDKSHPIAFLCHHGQRSKRIAETFRTKGFTNIFNVIGGISEWSSKINNKIDKY